MNRIDKKFQELKKKKRKAAIVYLTVGYPDVATTEELVLELSKAGVDMFELGMPFSDPLADGPVIQEACQRSLVHNTTPEQALTLVRKLREKYATGIVLFSCYNLILQYGLEAFAAHAAKAGVDGVIATDLPPEEATDFKAIFFRLRWCEES